MDLFDPAGLFEPCPAQSYCVIQDLAVHPLSLIFHPWEVKLPGGERIK